jgi:farnesyl diphosphate synthase
MADLESRLDEVVETTALWMDRLLPQPAGPEAQLLEAMRYATMGGGKRLRPFLVMESGKLFGVDEVTTLRIATALECIHTYSLVHDDLPCMDDDDMRRGRPSTHREYDEATAVLVGDGLLTLAFEIISDAKTHPDPFIRCELVSRLALAAGHRGMVGGQMIDLGSENKELAISAITRLQRMKTGALIAFACESGAIASRASHTATHAINAYAHDLGLAFQIVDDLLDVEGSSDELGKTSGKDEVSGKATFVAILGPERARAQAELLAAQAVTHLDLFDQKADLLRSVVQFVVNRKV